MKTLISILAFTAIANAGQIYMVVNPYGEVQFKTFKISKSKYVHMDMTPRHPCATVAVVDDLDKSVIKFYSMFKKEFPLQKGEYRLRVIPQSQKCRIRFTY